MEDVNNNPKSIRSNFDRSDLISVFALVISLGALVVTFYEAKLLKEQQQLMQSSQQAAVWPYLDISSFYDISLDQVTYKLQVNNKGVGPALLRDHMLVINGQVIESYSQLSNKFSELFGSENFILNYTMPSGILSPEESFTWVEFSKSSAADDLSRMRNLEIEYQLEYANIYKEMWRLDSENNEPLMLE